MGATIAPRLAGSSPDVPRQEPACSPGHPHPGGTSQRGRAATPSLCSWPEVWGVTRASRLCQPPAFLPHSE